MAPLYTVRIDARAQKDLQTFSMETRYRVVAKIESLGANPRPPGIKKLKGEDNLYRLRVGSYRILYTIRDKELLVLVVRIGDRRDVYKKGK